MIELWNTLEEGGPVVIVILCLSVALYTRCFGLLIHLVLERRRIARAFAASAMDAAAIVQLRAWLGNLQETFRRQRFTLGAMIAAAPLLGLLGTVTGMISTFGSLAERASQRPADGLAGGISEALVATKAGLSVAIPAVLLVYYADRQVQKGALTAARLEQQFREKS